MSSAAAHLAPSAFTDLAAIALGLALLAAGTVTAIGGTGLMMWVFGL